MLHIDWRSRLRAATLHSLGCLAVALLALALVFLVWYPWPWAVIAGGLGLFQLIVGVDIVIGPVITFAVFDRRKAWPVLRRDIAVIVLLQLVALGYGLHTLFVARPVALALETDRFRAVSAVEVLTEELPQAPEGLRQLPLGGPHLLRTEAPTDPTEKFESITTALAGADLGMRPRYWRDWDDTARAQVREHARPLERLVRTAPDKAEALERAIADTGLARERVGYLPLLARRAEWIVLVDRETGDPVGYADTVGD